MAKFLSCACLTHAQLYTELGLYSSHRSLKFVFTSLCFSQVEVTKLHQRLEASEEETRREGCGEESYGELLYSDTGDGFTRCLTGFDDGPVGDAASHTCLRV